MTPRDQIRIQAKIKEALESIDDDDFTIQVEAGKVTTSGMTFQVIAEPVAGVDLEQTPNGRMFKFYAPNYGVRADALGETFIFQGRMFKLTGVKTSRPKYPFTAECMRSGKGYKFPADTISAQFPKKSA